MDNDYWKKKIENIKDKIVDFGPKLGISIIIFIIFYVIANYYKESMIVRKKKKNNYYQESESEYISNEKITQNLIHYQLVWIVYYTILGLGITFALINLGFDIATIVTILASLGLAIGLALQGTFTNMISGLNIGINNMFSIGEEISLKPLGSVNIISGMIVDFNLYFTSIVDSKTNQLTMIPNSLIQSNILTNITRSN
jgi:small conductance mechanosensitive channel